MIINEYIKSTQHILCLLYANLFNKLDTGIMQLDWFISTIVPLHKTKETAMM